MSQEIEFDYIIIGAGILGSACAYSMSRKLETLGKRNRIAVLDLDLEGEFSSTLKNAGGVRATWRNEANIQLCNYSIGFYESIGKEIDFKQTGYYWLHNEQTRPPTYATVKSTSDAKTGTFTSWDRKAKLRCLLRILRSGRSEVR